MGTIVEHLRMLRDVQGVYGSFVVAETGALVDRDLPAAFEEGLFTDVGPRIARLFETFVSGGRDMETCMLRYAEHKLYVRKMTWGIMAVLSSATVNLPALRMVANLVVRRIDPEIVPLLARRSSSSPPVPTPAPAAVKSTAPPVPSGAPKPRTSAPPPVAVPIDVVDATDLAPPGSDRQVRMYRGRPAG